MCKSNGSPFEILHQCCSIDLWRLTLKVYHSHKVNANGKKSWQGGKNLSETAIWPWSFCSGLLWRWETQFQQSPENNALPRQIADVQMVDISDSDDE